MLTAWLVLAGWMGSYESARAQVYSQNIVGYYNLLLRPGDNLIANQFEATGGNSLNNLFQAGIPNGATFTKWNAASVQYLPLSTYDASSGWSINYDLNLGEGGLFNAPTAFTNTFVGSVWPAINAANFSLPNFGQPVIPGSGLHLLSCLIPIAPANFYEVTGRNPDAGDFVQTLDSLTQTWTTTTFDGDFWDNGAPTLAIGQSAFFGLGPQALAAPEPTACGLLGVGMCALISLNRKHRQK